MTRTNVGDAEGDDDDDEVRLEIPPALAAAMQQMAKQHAEMAQRLAQQMAPQLETLNTGLASMLTPLLSKSLAPLLERQREIAETVASSIAVTVSSESFRELQRAIGAAVPVPPTTRDFLSPAPATPALDGDDPVTDATVEALQEAGVSAADIDHLAVVIVVLRMMAMTGVAGAGFAFPPLGIIASLRALQDFLSELIKLRDLLASRETPDT